MTAQTVVSSNSALRTDALSVKSGKSEKNKRMKRIVAQIATRTRWQIAKDVWSVKASMSESSGSSKGSKDNKSWSNAGCVQMAPTLTRTYAIFAKNSTAKTKTALNLTSLAKSSANSILPHNNRIYQESCSKRRVHRRNARVAVSLFITQGTFVTFAKSTRASSAET